MTFFLHESCIKKKQCVFSYLHDVPDDAGTFTAGRHTLFVIRPDFDAGNSGFVAFEGLQEPVAVRLQLPNPHLQQTSPDTAPSHMKKLLSALAKVAVRAMALIEAPSPAQALHIIIMYECT